MVSTGRGEKPDSCLPPISAELSSAVCNEGITNCTYPPIDDECTVERVCGETMPNEHVEETCAAESVQHEVEHNIIEPTAHVTPDVAEAVAINRPPQNTITKVKVGQRVQGLNEATGKVVSGKIISRAGKATGKYKDCFNIKHDDSGAMVWVNIRDGLIPKFQLIPIPILEFSCQPIPILEFPNYF